MQDQNQKTINNPIPTAKPEPAVKPVVSVSKPDNKVKAGVPKVAPGVIPQTDFERRIIDKIRSSENILVALSRDPSVDEMAAAIGLTMFLDGLQKHTTAIYSGATPDALQFLQPADTFESNTDSLQDFIIALSKDKADHLRYKLEGDFVKVYITPYKTVLSENDLEFSHGDYNVDLVLALGVPQATDLDEALSEYGRIMHDATTVDITCDAPGRFGEIEWSDPSASSVSEMITKLIFTMQGKDAVVDKEIATALLTGIVAATGRFSNNRTNSETMQLASKLMSMGADQQLISANVMDNDTGVVNNGPSFADYNTPLPTQDYVEPVAEPVGPVVVPVEVPIENGIQQAIMTQQAQNALNSVTPEVKPESMEPVAQVAEQPVAPAVENGPKDYGAMLAAALEEPATIAGMPVPPAVSQATQPVVNDSNGVVLPPPPAPTTGGDVMPPVLPKVQVPADLAAQQAAEQAQALAAQQAQASQVQQQANPGAFQIPGM